MSQNQSPKAFQGVFTALITPFTKSGSIDWAALERLVELQVEANVAGIVPCGTTGEAPTLSHDEQIEVIRKVVRWVDGRTLVIPGTGSNNTAHAVEVTKEAEQLGVDGCLVVNPYYNKPTQEGLYRHYKAVADAVSVPIILYNIRGRTGVNVETDTLCRLIAECPNLQGDKEASGDMNQIRDVIARTPATFSVLSGDDGLTLDLIRAGGDGVISVASNLIPQSLVAMVDYALKGEFDQAEAINTHFSKLFEVLFVETNPIPLKAACAKYGLCKEVYRLPLCELEASSRKQLDAVLDSLDLSHLNPPTLRRAVL